MSSRWSIRRRRWTRIVASQLAPRLSGWKGEIAGIPLDSPLGLGIARLVVDPFSYWINTSAPQEVAAFEARLRAGLSPLEAVCDLAGVDPAELLGSQRMRDLVQGLTKRYDFVLIDSPPILPVADTLMLSRVVDSVVMVVRSTHTDRKQAQEARRRLLAVHARILGVVLNDLDLSQHRASAGGYSWY